MERQKYVSRDEVMKAVESFLRACDSESISTELLEGNWVLEAIKASSGEVGEGTPKADITDSSELEALDALDVLDIDDEIDMGDLLSPAFESSVAAKSESAGAASAPGSSLNAESPEPGQVQSESLMGESAWRSGELMTKGAGSIAMVVPPAVSQDGPQAQRLTSEASSDSLQTDGSTPAEGGGQASTSDGGPSSTSDSGPGSTSEGSLRDSSGGSQDSSQLRAAPVQQVEVKKELAGDLAAQETLSRAPEQDAGPPPLDPNAAPSDDEVPETWGRYRVDCELARGGQGRILNAYDDNIGRPVALKILKKDGVRDTRLVGRFYIEAQVTGQLEHPNIVPVYELGWIEGGLPYYIMKKVEGWTLKKVIFGLRKNKPETVEKYNRIKLLSILQQVCMAISFAHDRGVIHRDLKPANIMLGDYGEVIVVDWGVAKVRGIKDPIQGERAGVTVKHRGGAFDTQAGTVEGTPAYMSPEQARGRVNEIDQRTDVYALGAILYEILAYRPPFRGKEVREVLRKVVEDEPMPPRVVAPANQIPEELENICLKALAKNPDDRYASAHELQEEITGFLEGTKRRMEAAKKVAESRELVRTHQALKRELLLARMVAKRAAQGIEGWEPIERKRGVWATRDRVQEVEANSHVTFGEAVGRFSQALAHEPENVEAREGLADLFMEQLKKAEGVGDKSEVVYLESMIRQYGGQKYAAFLKGDGFLSIDTEQPGTEVWLYQYEERDRVLRPVDARPLGVTPVVDVRLPKGSYLVVLRTAGKRDVYYPVRLNRLEAWRASVRQYSHEEIGDGFVYIPGGPVTLGGDREAIDALEKEGVTTDDFAIHEFPITFGEYIEFLNAWLAADPDEAERCIPRIEDGAPLVCLTNKGYVPIDGLIGPEGRALGRPGMEFDVPVFGIDYDHADAFCAWRTEITGREHRIPTEAEWEKAARGVDGRVFPWGNQFDPIFCKSRLSRPWSPEPEPIGSFPEDTSPFGVRDLAGGVREWCDGWFNEFQGLRVMRGGSYLDSERFLRSATRTFYDPYLTKRIAGFRCARSLGR